MKDWINPKAYCYTKHLDRRGWAWEFLRRNKGYQAAWGEYSQIECLLTEKYGKENIPCWRDDPIFYIYDPPICQGEKYQDWVNRVKKGTEEPFLSWYPRKWGLVFMIDPTYDNINNIMLLRMWHNNIIGSKSAISLWPRGQVLGKAFESPYNDPIQIVKFDLRNNVDDQLAGAKLHLLNMQNALISKGVVDKIKRKNFKPDEWISYIRILDAEYAGLTGSTPGDNETIFKALQIPDRGSSTKIIDDRRRIARYLRDGGYLEILKSTPSDKKMKKNIG